MQGMIDPCEKRADKFAIENCGLDTFLKTIDALIEIRKKWNDDKSTLAIKEFEIRKKIALSENNS